MLTRRQLLSTAIAGSAALMGGASAARAFTFQSMTPAVAADYASGGCSAAAKSGDHTALIQQARTMLLGEIASGAKPAGAEEIVSCPICGCRMVVTAAN